MNCSTFCPIPWTHLQVKNSGDICFCCQGGVHPNLGFLKDENGKNLNIANTSFSQALNSPTLKSIRLSMMNGEKHPLCKTCWDEEKSNILSRRQYETQNAAGYINAASARNMLGIDGSISDEKLTYLDLRLGTQCNLKCVMCGPTDSNQWYEDAFSLGQETFYEGDHEVQLKKVGGRVVPSLDLSEWGSDENFWQQIEQTLPSLTRMYLAGGEPIIARRHQALLEKCIASGYAKNIILEYATNLTFLPNKVLKLWEHFKQIRLVISIDGTDAVNSYIRFPARWNDILANLTKVDESSANISACVNPTISILNIFDIPFLIQFLIDRKYDRIGNFKDRSLIDGHLLINPPALNIQNLPRQGKAEINRYYKSFFKKLKTSGLPPLRIEKTIFFLESLLSHMNDQDHPEAFEKSVSFLRKMDQLRKNDFLSIAPRLKKYVDMSQ